MPEPAAFHAFRADVRTHLEQCGALPDVAASFADALPLELAAGHVLCEVNGRFYQRSQLAAIGVAMGFPRTPPSHG